MLYELFLLENAFPEKKKHSLFRSLFLFTMMDMVVYYVNFMTFPLSGI